MTAVWAALRAAYLFSESAYVGNERRCDGAVTAVGGSGGEGEGMGGEEPPD